MNRVINWLLMSFLVAVCPYASSQQGSNEGESAHKIVVNKVDTNDIASVQLKLVNNSDSDLVMPFCGKRGPYYTVCSPPGFMEQFDGTTWNRVQLKYEHLIGEWSSAPIVVIHPHEAVQVDSSIRTDLFTWKRDLPVRLGIAIWPPGKPRTSTNAMLYTTPPLQPPSAGRLSRFSVIDSARQTAETVEQSRTMEVTGVSPDMHEVSMDVEIVNDSGFDIAFQTCAENEIQQRFGVCFPSAFFEEYDGSVWKAVERIAGKQESGERVATEAEVSPRKYCNIEVTFTPDAYQWTNGRPIRLMILAWPASDKTRSPTNAIRFVTVSLHSPSSGRLAFHPQ